VAASFKQVFRGTDPVQKEDAIQVVDLMLDRHRLKTDTR
jgi:hypothetical protein